MPKEQVNTGVPETNNDVINKETKVNPEAPKKPQQLPETLTLHIKHDDPIKKMNIFEKLSAISLEITNVAKNLNVGVGKSTYKAVGEADVLAAVRPAEAKLRVYSYPFERVIIDSGTVESTNYNGEVKKQIFERIEVTYRFINMDNPQEFIDIKSYGDGIDAADKSVGKAMTYADKYALLKAYKIITGDDPDQEESKPLAGKTNKTTTAPTAKKGVSPELAAECEALGGTLEQIAKKKNMKVEDLTDDIVRPILIAIKRRNAVIANATPQDNVGPAIIPQEE